MVWFTPSETLRSFRLFGSFFSRQGSSWRFPDVPPCVAFPNYKPSLVHHRHRKFSPISVYGIQSGSRLRVIDDSELGRKAMAERKPPKVIQVQAAFHKKKPHGALGKLGDRVSLAIMGEVRHGVIVGLKQRQNVGVPKFDSNNVVLIDRMGAPLGTRIHAPIPIILKQILKENTIAKKADYTKILSIATRFV
ncbi:large ribosomal subunit protein uL14m [Lepeophtheirus salmonis]|uniref:large ribosomal subunit protein uL14m n=1 Tax=Lepeophtheirus salmonis TaxID=72036 RepID=UPI001AEA27B3|nr:39S ribosomal protein L14, mitochondrial-like [Lepeophtheirus salmonis]